MNTTIRTIIGILLILLITFSAITIFQNIGKGIKADITDQEIYTLSDGTKNILGKLNQPIKVRLYYAETAALKASDQIRFFNNYYTFVRELLEEYESSANGMITLEIIDPRPFSEEEAQALRYGLQRFPITEEENFFFGLAIQTPFGIEKTIPFFAPDRQSFVEYDISYLIDTAVTRQKSKVGILSSLPIMGDDISPYMAMMMQQQNQQPRPAWGIVDQLRQEYEVTTIEPDLDEIKDIDILLVIHPKELSDKTLFAIDQFVLKGGRTIACVDPYCLSDIPDRQQMQMGMPPKQFSELNILLNYWGLDVPPNTFAGDRLLTQIASLNEGGRRRPIILLNLTKNNNCFSSESVAAADLNNIRMLYPGVINEIEPAASVEGLNRMPIVMTTKFGNSWQVSHPYELMNPDTASIMNKLIDGTDPIKMGYQVTGKFQSAFPNGIDVPVPISETTDPNQAYEEKTKHVTGLTKAEKECVVMVFSDVDFIADMLAYQQTFFGKAPAGDNSALLTNSIGELTGSTDLISIRSRGNFSRPFTRVDAIEAEARQATEEKINAINAEIENFQNELKNIIQKAQASGQEIMGSSILEEKRKIETKIRLSQKELRDVKMSRRQDIEALGSKLKSFCTLLIPAIILLIAILLGIFRTVRKRHYISHASDS
ncbi:MAG: Gldg family protein [Phycisphaerae bacterium]|nr:Gldg family protein [Phycisphaerae bacterium]